MSPFPAPGVTIDFLQDETTSGYGKDHNNVSYTSSAPGTDWSHDDFGEEDHETVDGGGHANTTYNTSTNDGHGNMSIISESDYVTDTFDDRFNNSDSGGETITDSANTETSDTEGDSDTETDTLHATTNETNTAHDVYTSTFPSGLVAKATYDDNGSTDAVTYDLSDYLTDAHSSSLGTGVSDTKSGGFSAKSVNVENDHIQEGVNFTGKDSNGTLLALVETASQNDTVTDTQSNINTLNSDGSDSDTIGDIRTARGTVTDSVTGTVTSVDPTTGNATTLAYQDTLTDTGSSSSSDGDIVTQTANGASTNTAGHTDGGSDTFTWAISETETQTDKNGNSIGSSDSNTDSGSGTETFSNGVVTSATLNAAAGNNNRNTGAAVANAVGTTSTAQATPSAGATNGTSGKRMAPVGGYEAPWWSGVQGFAHGFFVTGSKAIVNQSAKAVGGLVSLGRWEPGNLIGVNPQTDIGYDSAAVPARIAAESTIAAATMGASNLGRAGQVLNAVDTAGNLVNGTAGVVDVVQTGQVTLKNVTQIATGGIAVVQVVGASRSIAKGCPGHGPNCFVAGTKVLIQSEGSGTVECIGWRGTAPTDSESGLASVVMIGAAIALGVAKSKLKEEDEEQSKSRLPRKRPQGRRTDDGGRPRDFYDTDADDMTATGSGMTRVTPNNTPGIASGEQRGQSGRSWVSRTLTTAALFFIIVGGWVGTHASRSNQSSNAIASVSEVNRQSTLAASMNIEDVRPGQRVVGRNPIRKQTQAPSQIDAASWRLFRLEMVQDGTFYELAFLRPESWTSGTSYQVTGTIPLVLEELGLNGEATVVDIEPCPPLEPDDGTGRMLVTGTMKHLASNVLDLEIDGESRPLGVTSTHPMWSEDRKDFVPAGKLQVGEHLRRNDGSLAQVQRITPQQGPSVNVYNLEVDGEHVFHVGDGTLLVHNDCSIDTQIGMSKPSQKPHTGVLESSAAPNNAFNAAQAGGKHAGFLKNYAGKSASELKSGIASLQKQIAEHADKIANPEKYIPNFKQLDPRQQAALLGNKWPSDIARLQEQADILQGLLKLLGGS